MVRQKLRIVNRLWLHRVLMGFSQAEVAKRLNLKCSNMISRWERGQAIPGGKYLLMLSVLYKTLPNELYYELVKDYQKELFPSERIVISDILNDP